MKIKKFENDCWTKLKLSIGFAALEYYKKIVTFLFGHLLYFPISWHSSSSMACLQWKQVGGIVEPSSEEHGLSGGSSCY